MESLEIIPEVENQEQMWRSSAAGIYLQENEQTLFDSAVFDLFGFNALQMGFASMALLRNSRIANRFIAADKPSASSHLYCADDFLPFAEVSLDLLLLPHRLEFSERPHQTLREAARVIMPEGHLIITGFNPWSAWGLKSMLKKYLYLFKHRQHPPLNADQPWMDYPWHARMIRLARLKDWLTLLNFEVISVNMLCHAPPFSREPWLKKCTWLDAVCKKYLQRLGLNRFGGVYFIVAKKRVPGMTPLKPQWKTSAFSSALASRPKSTQHHQQKTKVLEENGHQD